MGDRYGMTGLGQYVIGGESISRPDSFAAHPFDMLVNASNGTLAASTGGEGGGRRWPRQETLTLLEIRSRLDFMFKEANQKGPLWDEISRIMIEEHGYQRSGKKCREKFENVYKYYKKTKEGKSGRQDGKNYRFFRQLEALCGETTNRSPSLSGSQYDFPNSSSANHLNLSDTSFELSINSSDSDVKIGEDDGNQEDPRKKKKRKSGRGWKGEVIKFIDMQMKKLVDKQEAWMEKMMRTIEDKENERMIREEEWRKQEALRIEREHKFWDVEREWIRARDAAFMHAFQKLNGKESLQELVSSNGSVAITNSSKGAVGVPSSDVWDDELSHKMSSFGHDRNRMIREDKWDSVNNYALKCNHKRRESSKSCTNICPNKEPIFNPDMTSEQEIDHLFSANNNSGSALSDGCFRYLMENFDGLIQQED